MHRTGRKVALLCVALNLNACGSEPKAGTEGDTTGQVLTTGTDSSPATAPTSSTAAPVDCETFAEEDSVYEGLMSLRNLRDSPIFMVFGACGEVPFEIFDPVTMGRSPDSTCLEHPCFEQVCPHDCLPVSPFLIAPGKAGPALPWDGRLTVQQDLPLTCLSDEANGEPGTVQCEVLKVASAGKLEVRVFFTSELMGCDPDPCDCVPNAEGWCQVFPSMASIGAEVAIGTLEFPTDKVIEVGVQ